MSKLNHSIVIVQTHSYAEQSRALAERSGLPLASQDNSADYCLLYHNGKLTLRNQSTKKPQDVCVDFCSGKNRHRLQYGGGHGQPLARAVGAKKLEKHQTLCDATAGFGNDSLVFATLGCNVVLIEQSRVVYELLQDGLTRALRDPHLKDIATRMQVHHADSTRLPAGWPHSTLPETVYLDPMYPLTTKSASAKKEMQTLKHLLSPPTASTDQQLLRAALATANKRVVVKRPKNAPPIEGLQPSGNISSTNTRYDLYNAQM